MKLVHIVPIQMAIYKDNVLLKKILFQIIQSLDTFNSARYSSILTMETLRLNKTACSLMAYYVSVTQLTTS
jgi:hypothetical protein